MNISTRLRSMVSTGAIVAAVGAAFLLTRSQAQQPPRRLNKIAGTWSSASIQGEIGGKMIDLYGPAPTGSLVFTADMRFVDIINDPRIPHFASDDRAKATQAETLIAAKGNLALYGTYTVGEDGQFWNQIVEGSSFPNWIGLKRGREQLTLNADGDTMIENFANLPDGPRVRIIWKRVSLK